ncbi:hypothetical protein [Sphingomonas jaspsi]|uniref:hypothetical protein n=1 Tax=Sphingomonas jaspsi TaxID=392409 RepID=UPI0004B973D6|nr:hypothetical protein [Sphingomonas jaspsi]
MRWNIVLAATLIVATAAAASKPAPTTDAGAPPASEQALYCLKVEAVTGTRIERVQCHTRKQWADWDVDVDREWAKEGVRVIA